LLCVPLALLAGVTEYCALMLTPLALRDVPYNPALAEALATNGIGGLLPWATGLLWAATVILAVGAMVGLLRRRWTLKLIRRCYVGVYVLAAGYVCSVFAWTGMLARPELPVAGEMLDAVSLFMLRWSYLWPAALGVAAFALLHVISLRGKTLGIYDPPAPTEPTLGDRVLANLRTHGRDPRYRKSVAASVVAQVLVIVVLPWLLTAQGCVEPYLAPWGSGTPAVAHVRIVRRKPKKKRKKLLLNPKSKIAFGVPESDLMRQIDQETLLTYEANVAAVHGKMGAGGGKRGGWPDGVPGGELRFIRIRHGGRDWDDGMDKASRADANFLTFIRKEVPFRVRRTGEAHRIGLLPKYPPGRAPPFMYLTGESTISGVSKSEIKILREYCLNGGMLFADAGSNRFDRDFRHRFIRLLFPDKRLVDIPDDDPIFQMPFIFPNGSPPLWHHGGRKARGIKHRGRWCVFYHPGDLNDAWKTGHSGLRPKMAKAAHQMGVNVVYYAITHYLEATRKERK